jgi:hypothetical protein
MPKRTNLFQEVVEIIHRHMAGDAEVEASAMLPSRSTGALREVDVVIRGKQAGHETLVSVEAVSSRSRKANREWVDRMLGKHDDLPTNKLVLVSEKGFTKDARERALAAGAVPLAPEDLEGDNPESAVIKALPALWPKVVTLKPEELGVKFADDDAPTTGWEIDPPIVVLDDSRVVGNLWEFVKLAYHENWVDLMQQIGVADVTEDETRSFRLHMEGQGGEDVAINLDDRPHPIYLLNANGRAYSLTWIEAKGTLEIRPSKIPLKAARLGEVEMNFAFGEGQVAGRDALLVLTEGSGGKATLTLRIRPIDQPSDSDADWPEEEGARRGPGQ